MSPLHRSVMIKNLPIEVPPPKERNYSLLYHPNCACQDEQEVMITHFPMPKMFKGICTTCKTTCTFMRAYPLTFIDPYTQYRFGMAHLRNIRLLENWQKPIMKLYISSDY